jgi:S1-C subfamily serine protease
MMPKHDNRFFGTDGRVYHPAPPFRRRGRVAELAAVLVAVTLAGMFGAFSGYHAAPAVAELCGVQITQTVPCPPGRTCPQPAPSPARVARNLPKLDTGPRPSPWETSVRISVQAPDGFYRGSGTIIDGHPDRVLVMTCAHMFRTEAGVYVAPQSFRPAVSVEMFDGTPAAKLAGTYPARVVDYDPDRDVALIAFKAGRVLRSTPLVMDGYRAERGNTLVSVGCSEGGPPSMWAHRIRGEIAYNVDRPGTPYDAVVVEPKPVQGRSGGGLFSLDGRLVGVCNSAEIAGTAGFYAAPTSTRFILERNGRDDLAHPTETTEAPDIIPGQAGNRDRPSPQLPAPQLPEIKVPAPPLGLDSWYLKAGLIGAAVGFGPALLRSLGRKLLGRHARAMLEDLTGAGAAYEKAKAAAPATAAAPPQDLDATLGQLLAGVDRVLIAMGEREKADAEAAATKQRNAEILAKLRPTSAPGQDKAAA